MAKPHKLVPPASILPAKRAQCLPFLGTDVHAAIPLGLAAVYEPDMGQNDVLSRLAANIKARRTAKPEDSHTRRLLDGAPIKPAKKLGEEAVETAIAALAQDDAALIAEAADLLYHLLVVLESRHITLDDVLGELERRMGATGLTQKRKAASR